MKSLIKQETNVQSMASLAIKPGQRGVDVRVISGNPGFMFAEIKPGNPNQYTKLLSQIHKWGFEPTQVLPITYDALGGVYYGF